MRRFIKSLPYLAVVLAGYLIPAIASPFTSGSTEGWKALVFGSLFFINPAVTLLAGGLCSYRIGVKWWFPIAGAALFLPVALIPPLNSSAWVYAVAYLVTLGLGTALGGLLRGRRPRTAATAPGAHTVG